MWIVFATLFINVFVAAEFYNTEKCGKSVGCWYFPKDCTDTSCHAIIRWKVRKNLVRIELQAKDIEGNPELGRYMALGFSQDKFMDNDTVIECIFDGKGKGKAFVSYNDHATNLQLEDASSKLVKLKDSVISDNRLLCKIDVNFGKHKKLKEEDRNRVINTVRNNSWTLLFAQGLADPTTREKYIHAFYPWVTEELVEMCDDCESKFMVVSETSPHEVRRI